MNKQHIHLLASICKKPSMMFTGFLLKYKCRPSKFHMVQFYNLPSVWQNSHNKSELINLLEDSFYGPMDTIFQVREFSIAVIQNIGPQKIKNLF